MSVQGNIFLCLGVLVVGGAAFAPQTVMIPDDMFSSTASSEEADTVQPEQSGDPVRGESLYLARCGACHSVNANRVGPRHQNTFGSPAGSVEGYNYSSALKQSGIIWNEETLDQWLQNPTAMVPGTKMGFRLSKATDRKDVIAYLENISIQTEDD